MSLPFLLARSSNAASSSSTKTRGRGVGQDPHVALARGSFDATASVVGNKRSAAHLFNEVHDGAQLATAHPLGLPHETGFGAPKRPRVVVVGAGPLASHLVECLAGKPGFVQLGMYGSSDAEAIKWQLLPGVLVHSSMGEAAKWSEVIVLCGNSYKEGDDFLAGVNRKHLHGRVVLQMVQGTPDQARATAERAEGLGAKYLDACLLTPASRNVFGHRSTSIVASGSKEAWDVSKDVILAVAPASFYGSNSPAGSNAIAMGIFTILAALHMGLRQASAFVERFGVASHVLPSLLAKDFTPLVKQLLTPQLATPTATSTATSLPNTFTSTTTSTTTSTANIVPAYGSSAWLEQLEQIQRVCQEANVDHSIIDGFLSASGRTASVQQSGSAPVSVNAGLLQGLQHLHLQQGGSNAKVGEEDKADAMSASSWPGSPRVLDVAGLLGLGDDGDDLFMPTPMDSALLVDPLEVAWAP